MGHSASQQFKIKINGVKMSILTFASSLRRLWSTACLLCVEMAFVRYHPIHDGKLVLPSPVSALGEKEDPPPPPPSSPLFI